MRTFKSSKFKKGHTQGDLEILEIDNSVDYRSGARTRYICRCNNCNSTMSLSNATFSKTNRENCGCLPQKDLVGRKFGKIEIIKFGDYDTRYGRKRAAWVGVCGECGIIKSYLQDLLLRGDISGCGKCKPKGEDSPRYNPQCDRFNRRDSTEYKAWCKEVYERDEYKCDCCRKSGRINAHHLDGWNWCHTRRFDVDNGVTLCAGMDSCHNDFHKIFGSGNNTRLQYVQYKRMRKNGKK
jgi:hypothetical protein